MAALTVAVNIARGRVVSVTRFRYRKRRITLSVLLLQMQKAAIVVFALSLQMQKRPTVVFTPPPQIQKAAYSGTVFLSFSKPKLPAESLMA